MSNEYEVKSRVIQLAKQNKKPKAILEKLKLEFPADSSKDLVKWIDDLIE